MACISRFATAILSGETELALGTIRVNVKLRILPTIMNCHAGRKYLLVRASLLKALDCCAEQYNSLTEDPVFHLYRFS